jgi:hypothetical protein
MGKPRNSSAPSPSSIASLSTALILITGVGMAFYFGELRGPGLQSFVTGSRVIETGVLCGILVALVVSAHLAIINSVRQSRASSPYRALVRRASQCDVENPSVANEFEAAPEVADLVRRLVAQHERMADLSGGLDALRGEIQGLAAGMRRSKDDLHPVRQDARDAASAEITRIWNELLERVRAAAAPAGVARPVTPAVPAFGIVDLAAGSAPGDETRGLSARIERLESTLHQINDQMRARDAQVTPAVPPPISAAAGIEATPGSPYGTLPPADDTLLWNPPPATPSSALPEFTEALEDTEPERAESEAPAFEPPQFTPPRFDVPRFEVPRFEPAGIEAPAPSAAAPAETSHFAAPETAFAHQEPRFEDLRFPHFVGQPVRKVQPVEVTYGSDSGLCVEEDDAGAKGDVVDLRSLGAVEFKE